MRLRARTDRNQIEIVKALRQIGCSVKVTSKLGRGFPDLVVGRGKRNLLLELKDGKKPLSERQLTEDEQKFKREWAGQYAVVESPEDAVDYVMQECAR